MTEGTSDRIHTLEAIVTAIASLKPAERETRDALTLWPERLHLALGPSDRLELFIEGDRSSFGQGATGQALEFGSYRDINRTREFVAVLVRARAGESSVRPMAHLAYEALQCVRADPEVTNEALLHRLGPYFPLVVDREILTTDQQIGLTAELMFLQDLLNATSRLGITAEVALDCWTGWESASRDFKGGEVAVEVKASRSDRRLHWVHPMYQLLPAEGEAEGIYVFSVGIQVDRSRSFRFLTMFDRVLESLPASSRPKFLDRIGQYVGVGFEEAQRRQYELEPGFLVSQPPRLFRVDHVDDILQPGSFVGGQPPRRVHDLRYRVSLDGLPATSATERNGVLEALLARGPDG